MPRYRIDFLRLPRTLEEMSLTLEQSAWLKSSGVRDILELIEGKEGYILDSINVADKENASPSEIVQNHLKNRFEEAILVSYEIAKLRRK